MNDLFNIPTPKTSATAVPSSVSLAVPSPAKIGGFTHDRDLDNGKEEWLTPPYIIEALGEFDLDPCGARQHQKQGRGIRQTCTTASTTTG